MTVATTALGMGTPLTGLSATARMLGVDRTGPGVQRTVTTPPAINLNGAPMPRFAANLSMLFTEYPFLERFDRAAAAGFEAVEFLFPYAEDVPGIQAALKRTGLTQVLFNLPPGDFGKGERGLANNPAKQAEFREGVARGLEIASSAGLWPAELPHRHQLAGSSRGRISLRSWPRIWPTPLSRLRPRA